MGIIGAVVKGVTGYAAARSKERTTALGGGLCVAALYFRVMHPKAMDEIMFYIVFGLGALVALLKTEFMRVMAVAIVDAMKSKKSKKSNKSKKSKKSKPRKKRK